MMSSDDPPFASLAIVGLGLIGGSIALGIRERWPSVLITGVDRSSVLAHAAGGGVIDRQAATVADLGSVELIILAAPVRQNIALIADLAGAAVTAGAAPAALVTDVGGTKRDIVKAAQALPGDVTFIGGHPIGGAERGGFGFARPDLFKGRPWIFTPPAAVAAGPLAQLSRLVEGLGAKPHIMAPDDHDRAMAALSHLPQIVASALMQVVGGSVSADGLRLAGRGLVDTTRLASSPADVWRDICGTNADAIRPALDALIARLTVMRDGLEQGDTIEGTFAEASRWRAELMKGRE
jgi:prephenate dehydrogenase